MISKILLSVVMIVIYGHSIAENNSPISERALYKKERQGIKLHKKGKYKKAHAKLSETAVWGLKDSQYFLALMYLKGQFVEQDIIKGMGYLGVANEANIEERKNLFAQIYDKLPGVDQKRVDDRVADYIAKYGMKIKNIICKETAELRSRVAVVNCEFYKTSVGGAFEIE